MLPWLLLQLFSKIHFRCLSAAFIVAGLSALVPASVGLWHFLSESLPACLHICLTTCFHTSAFTFKTFYFRWKTGNNGLFELPKPSCLVFIFHKPTAFIIPLEGFISSVFLFSFTVCSLSLSRPQLCFQFTGRQEGWLWAPVRLPKLTVSMDERPSLIALSGLLLSKQSPTHPLRKCVQCPLQSWQLHSHTLS